MSNPFDRNPYRIPPSWNPGYALPQNVDDEGLQRRAYTTAWAERGTFDDPKVGDAGYAVPRYVQDEGYGEGAMVTRWAPRGSYAGPRVPHWLDKQAAKVVSRKSMPGGATQLQIRALAGIEYSKTGETQYTDYGTTSAAALIQTVRMMPPSLRAKQLRKALDKIDPTLYARGEKLATAESKAGVPADVALERGLAAAMSHGMASELVDLGKGKKPARRSQLGSVCYGALGDTVTPGTCSADGQYIFKIASSGAGYWARKSSSDVCGGSSTATTTARTGPGGGVTVTDTATGQAVKTVISTPPPPPPADQKFVMIGPFLIPITLGAWRDHRVLSDEKKAWVDQNVAIAAKSGGVSIAEMQTGKYPFVKFADDQGAPWGLYYQVSSDGSTTIAYHKMPADKPLSGFGSLWDDVKDVASFIGGGIWEVLKKIWSGIKWVAAKVVDFVGDAVDWIKDKACDLFTSPVGQIAGAAAGAAVGGPAGAQAGAMGAQVAAQACSDPQPAAPVVTPPPEHSSLMPLLLIGGAGVAAVLLLGKKKH